MVQPTVKVTIIPRDIGRRLGRARAAMRPSVRVAIDNLGKFGVSTMKSLVPVRTGKLRQSIRIFNKTTSLGADLRANVSIGSLLPYAAAQDTGAKSSPGRYVPVLGRRITTGRHPGIKGTNFTQKTQQALLGRANIEVDRMIAKWKSIVRRA